MPSNENIPEADVTTFGPAFVTSTNDPSTGYFLPDNKAYIYRVQCANSNSCKFDKISTGGYEKPDGSSVMIIPAEVGGLACQ